MLEFAIYNLNNYMLALLTRRKRFDDDKETCWMTLFTGYFLKQSMQFLNTVNYAALVNNVGWSKVFFLFFVLCYITCTSRWSHIEGQYNMFLNHLLE